MEFKNHSLIYKIAAILALITGIISIVGLTITGIVFAAMLASAGMFFIYFGSGVVSLIISLVLVKLINWLADDFDHVNSRINGLSAKISKMERQLDLTDNEIIKTKTVISERTKKEQKPEVNQKPVEEVSDGEETELIKNEQTTVEESATKESEKTENQTMLIMEKGTPVILKNDFSEYGFYFKKGMKGILGDNIYEDTELVYVRMTDSIKGFFRFSVKYIEKDLNLKKK